MTRKNVRQCKRTANFPQNDCLAGSPQSGIYLEPAVTKDDELFLGDEGVLLQVGFEVTRDDGGDESGQNNVIVDEHKNQKEEQRALQAAEV